MKKSLSLLILLTFVFGQGCALFSNRDEQLQKHKDNVVNDYIEKRSMYRGISSEETKLNKKAHRSKKKSDKNEWTEKKFHYRGLAAGEEI